MPSRKNKGRFNKYVEVSYLGMKDYFTIDLECIWLDALLLIISCFRQLQKQLLFILLCVLLHSLSCFSQAQDYGEFITTEDGLSQGMIMDILQDKEGFLWIATKDGLNRFDGYEFKIFTNDPNDPSSISGNTIVKLFEDSVGRIWAATNNAGLNIYDKKTGRFHHLRHEPNDPQSLSGNNVSGILEDSSGYFITVIAEKEINMFKLEDDFFTTGKAPQISRIQIPPQKRAKRYNLEGEAEIEFVEIQGIIKDTKDRIWVGGNNAIYQFSPLEKQIKLAVEGHSFQTAFARADGSIWASSYSHTLFNWDGKNAKIQTRDYITIRDLWEDEQENLWISSIDSLYGIDVSGWTQEDSYGWASDHYFYRWKPEDKVFTFNSLITDQSGILWVGTYGYGVFKNNLKHKAFLHYLPGVSIRNMVLAPDNELYLQNYSYEWFKKDGPFKQFNRQVIDDPNTDAYLVSPSKEIWTRLEYVKQNYLQVKRYNPKTDLAKQYNISWHNSAQQPIISAQDSSIWMAGFDDIITHINPVTDTILSYDLKTGKLIDLTNLDKTGYSKNQSTALYEDQNGIIWVGTERGFTRVKRPLGPNLPLHITKYQNIPKDLSSLSYNHVSCFLDDPHYPDRFLWVCTKGGGLNRFDKKAGTFIHLAKKDGLPDDVVYGILSDDDSNIWGSTNKGLFCMSLNKDASVDNQEAYIFRSFSKADGLQGNEFNTGAYVKLPNGRLAFGGVNGYNVFNPKEVLSNVYLPPIYITNILVNNQPVSPRDDSEILESTIETSQEITLSYLDNIVTLEFAALDFTAPDHINYRYQLLGADDTWVNAGNRRSATFLNLPPDNYTFRVQGSNSQGIWNDKFAQLNITVLPPWWLTWWAYIVYALFAAFLFWRYYEFITKRAKLNQELIFEKSEAEKAKELDQLKTRLYTNLTHEFRTPLTIIIGMVDQINGTTEQTMTEGLRMIKRNGENLLQLVNKMLDLSKIESGKMVLDTRQGDIIQTLKNVSDSFVGYAANKDIEIHFLSDLDHKNVVYDDEKVRRIFSNLISNAIKFTLAGGHIYISVRQKENDLLIKVKDTGKGILPQQQDKIFDRFYQIESEDNRTSEGTGIGLALCKELVFLMGGKISVKSPPPRSTQGSEFTVLLPTTNVLQDRITIERPSSKLLATSPTSVVQDQARDQAVFKVTAPVSEIQTCEHKEGEKIILLVEDNADIVAYVALCLKDYKLIVATNGVEGLEMAIDAIPDLIISDVMMPIMDGFEMCEKIKQNDKTNHIPVIMLTAKADLASKIEGLEFGANAYISKPFDTVELLLTIRNLFNLRTQLQTHYQVNFNERKLIVTSETNEVAPLPKLDEFVIELRERIETRIDDFGLSVEDLANELHFSKGQLRRKLGALIGMTPLKYIRQIRLEKAILMLQDTRISIAVIAFDCGFSDPSYFSRVFKKEFGVSPQVWREENKENN